MKVLHLINSLTAGGAEKLLVDSAICYHKKGINIDILLLKGGDSPFLSKLKEFPKIKIYDLGYETNVYDPRLVLKLNKYFKNYDIIHVHLFPALYWAALVRLLFHPSQLFILTEHSTNNKRRKNRVFRIIDRFIYSYYHKIVTISHSAEMKLRHHLGASFQNLLTINNGIDLTTMANAKPYLKSDLGFHSKDFLLVQISSFRYPKDQGTVIRSLQLLNDNIHLILVGDGPLLEENISLVIDLNLTNRVHFLGIREDVPRLLKTADVAILSSHYEGLSLSSVEGLASGKPFIATKVQGLEEVVRDAGLLFSYQDYKELAGLVTKLFVNESFYFETAKKGLEKSRQYDLNLMINSYVQLYSSLI